MNTFEIFLYEMASLPERINGVRGAAMLVVLAAATVILPVRFGTSMLNPVLLIVLSMIAPLLAGNFLARSFATDKSASRIVNSDDPALAVATGKVLAATVWGVVLWVVFLAVPFAALNVGRARILLPSVPTLLALALFAGSLSWFATSIGSIFAAGAPSPSSAQTFIRSIILMPLLLLGGSASLLPAGGLAALVQALRGDRLPVTLLAVSAMFILAGFPALPKTAAKIEELRHPLSILGE